MWMQRAAAAALLTLATATAPVRAAQQPFGDGFDDWTFTQDVGKSGVNCRAIHRSGGRLDVLAFQSSGIGYASLDANGVTGRFPFVTLRLDSGDLTVGAEVSSGRLVLGPLNEFTLDAIAGEGGYAYVLPGTAGSGDVDLGDRAGEALDRIFSCLEANAR